MSKPPPPDHFTQTQLRRALAILSEAAGHSRPIPTRKLFIDLLDRARADGFDFKQAHLEGYRRHPLYPEYEAIRVLTAIAPLWDPAGAVPAQVSHLAEKPGSLQRLLTPPASDRALLSLIEEIAHAAPGEARTAELTLRVQVRAFDDGQLTLFTVEPPTGEMLSPSDVGADPGGYFIRAARGETFIIRATDRRRVVLGPVDHE